MLFTITKEFTFEAAHQLINHDGKCARLHGHSWKGRVIIGGMVLYDHGPKIGMLMDFGDVKSALQPIIDQYLDHHFLNETLRTDHPTSEIVAEWLYLMLSDVKFGPPGMLMAVEIDETCTSSCRYQPT